MPKEGSAIWKIGLFKRTEEGSNAVCLDCKPEKRIDEYCSMARESIKSDPLDFWKSNQKKFPLLSELLGNILAHRLLVYHLNNYSRLHVMFLHIVG